MDALATTISEINGYYWYLVIVLLVTAGVWFTLRTGVVQLRLLPEMVRNILEKPGSDSEDGISAFRAFTVLSLIHI